MPYIETILTPALFPLYQIENKAVVIIDILRATSSICVAFHLGIDHIIPFDHPVQTIAMRQQGYLVAAERDGQKLDGFDFGNSPFDYLNAQILNQKLAITTTNGTKCINMSKLNSHSVWIASFLNIQTLADHLMTIQKDIVLFCSGWKNKFNLEDTLFAGALAQLLQEPYTIECDATIAAIDLYNTAKSDLVSYITKAAHAQRFERMGIEKDIAFCMLQNQTHVLPYWDGAKLIDFKK